MKRKRDIAVGPAPTGYTSAVKTRRNFLKSAASCAPAAAVMHMTSHAQSAATADTKDFPPLAPNSIPPEQWPAQFDVAPGIINLENAYWGLMPKRTAAIYAEKILYVNRFNSIWGRGVLPGDSAAADFRAARVALAQQMKCDVDEVAITRSGSEGLQALIVNYRKIKAGDAMICCDLDYDSTLEAVQYLGDHRGVQIVKFTMPEPATEANILQAYEDTLKATPNAKLMLVTLVSHRTGLVTPMKKVVAMARARGVDVICDIAHGVACLDFTLPDLDCDFAAWSVHKWTMAPLGLGGLYIRKSRIDDIDVSYDAHTMPDPDITARVPAGVWNYPAILTIPAAVEFHFAVGAAAKEKHLRMLRDRWVHQVKDLPNVEICVPDDPARYCAITSFRLKGMHTVADAQKVQHRLFDKYRIHTVFRAGVAKGAVVRVAPGLYNTVADSDALAAALQAEHAMLL
jgi:selenocysteine lyase/cysteine desulfurase